MNNTDFLELLKQRCLIRGFNIFKIINNIEYDKYFPNNKKTSNFLNKPKSIILIGFGGNKFWKILNEYLDHNPDFSASSEDWIDEYTKLVFNEFEYLLQGNNIEYKYIFPFGNTAKLLDFMKIGEISGIGVKSLLGIILSPEYGTWMSFRGAILSDYIPEALDKPLTGFDPCPSCSKPCISECPANTISENGWDWKKCMTFRKNESTCRSNCFSRRACPYGSEHQYSYEQHAYHHRFVLKGL